MQLSVVACKNLAYFERSGNLLIKIYVFRGMYEYMCMHVPTNTYKGPPRIIDFPPDMQTLYYVSMAPIQDDAQN